MLAKIKRLLAPPVFDDDEKNQTARMLNVLLLSFIVIIFIFVTIQVITRSVSQTTIRLCGLCLSMIGLLYLMRRGYVRAASLLLASVAWVFVINLPVWLSGGGIIEVGYIANFVIIVAVNLIVGWQASMVFALLTILVGWGFAYAGYGLTSSDSSNVSLYRRMIHLTLFISLLTVLTTLTTTNLRKALKHARISNQELQAIRASLEERVVERTQRLQTVADMSGQLNAILDLERLLVELVRQVKEKFDYYHVHIYLLVGPLLRLAAGYGEAGARMKAEGHFIPLDAAVSLVAQAVRQREIIRVDDARQYPAWLPNPLLPHTQAEMAVPIIAEDRVIGVLDVQSDRVAGLDDSDADLLRSLANQAAIAIANARLFEQVETAKKRAETAKEESETAKEEAETAKVEAEAAKQKAEIASQAKSQFLSSMSHELRTPLNGILGYAQILNRGKDLTALQRDGLNIIHQSGEHLLTLINDILDLSKIEAGKLDLYPADFNLADCLNGVVGIIRIRAQQKGIAFDLEETPPLPKALYADEKRLRQVLLNLLNNAVKFTDHGNVILKVREAGSQVEDSQVDNSSTFQPRLANLPLSTLLRFEVIDTGVGIASEDLDKIFQPFEQVGENQRRAEGTGLGLSITRRLLEMMGSELRVDSQLGRGSAFWFEITLPLGQVQTYSARTRAAGQSRQAIGHKGQPRKVLIVDDKYHNRAVMTSILEPLGFVVTEADDGREGVRLAREQQPDLILMDMMMPGMTGFEATQIIRQIPELKEVIIFGVSASVFEENRQQVMTAGCDAFVSKPVEMDKLLGLIEKYLKLEWVYEEKEEITPSGMKDREGGGAITPEEAEIPPVEELQEIYTLAYNGTMKPIRERTALWKEQNPAFASFADKIFALARDFQDEQIMALLKPYLDPEKNE